jgi:lysozyme family protein
MSFARAIAYILRPDVEGGFCDDPQDPGGITNCGISKRSHPDMTVDEIRALTPATAALIYQHEYWSAIHGDDLPDAVGFALLDFAVNSGVSAAIHTLQRVLGATADGVMGSQTVHAAQIMPPKSLVRDLFEQRLTLMEAQPNYAHDGKGWRRRVIQTAIEAFQ